MFCKVVKQECRDEVPEAVLNAAGQVPPSRVALVPEV